MSDGGNHGETHRYAAKPIGNSTGRPPPTARTTATPPIARSIAPKALASTKQPDETMAATIAAGVRVLTARRRNRKATGSNVRARLCGSSAK